MKCLLDSNTCIGYLNGTTPAVLRRLVSVPAAEVAVCSVVKAELYAGAMKSRRPQRTLAAQRRFFELFHSLPFDDPAAEAYGRIRGQLEAAGTPIGPYDLQIAAIALAHGLTLVTHNVSEFARVPGIDLEDWEAAP